MPRAVVLVFVLLLLSACGGGDPPKPAATATATPDPAAQVREVAAKVAGEAGGYELCFENSTDRFIRALFKGDRDACRNLQRIIGPGTPKVLDVKVTGERAAVSVAYEGSAVKGRYGTLGFVREGGVWKLDRLETDFVRSTAVASVQALSVGALSVPEVQQCVAARALELSDTAVRRYVYTLYRLDDRTGPAALRLVEKCPKQVAIFVAEEVARGLEEEGYSRKYADCMQDQLEAYLVITEVAPKILAGSESVGFGTAAVAGILEGVEPECRRFK
jgi:hypothetical protein